MSETLSARELSIEEYGKHNFLRPVQRQELERSIAGIEERLAQPILLEMAGGDREALEKQHAKEQAMLASGSPPRLDAVGQRHVYKKMQKCEDLIVNGLPTFTMMERGRPADIDHHVAHENAPHQDEDGKYTTKRAIQAWKNYRLTLDPHSIEPNFLSIASLRTDTVRGNPALFRKNYDHIRFREYIEENLAEQLDDETYFTFCGLKALEWAEATIRSKLDWTQKMYDVAMTRWRKDTHKTQLPVTYERGAEFGGAVYQEEVEPEVQGIATPKSIKRGKNGMDMALLHKAYEPRVQIEPGWPRNELQHYGISVADFCKAWGQKSTTLFYNFTKKGQWVERHLHTARAALERLVKERRAEPVMGTEPATTMVAQSL